MNFVSLSRGGGGIGTKNGKYFWIFRSDEGEALPIIFPKKIPKTVRYHQKT